jgi:hypothetical protein
MLCALGRLSILGSTTPSCHDSNTNLVRPPLPAAPHSSTRPPGQLSGTRQRPWAPRAAAVPAASLGSLGCRRRGVRLPALHSYTHSDCTGLALFSLSRGQCASPPAAGRGAGRAHPVQCTLHCTALHCTALHTAHPVQCTAPRTGADPVLAGEPSTHDGGPVHR